LSISQILAVTWDSGPNPSLPHASIADRLNRVREVRSKISNAVDGALIVDLEKLKYEEDSLLNDLRCIGDAVIYSFFSKDKPRERQQELTRIHLLIEAWFASGLSFSNFRGLDKELKWLRSEKKLIPFHWECEFPEVFSNPVDSDSFGFDVFVGNPPFAGKNNIIASNPDGFLQWLGQIHTNSHGNSDIVAHFFRRCFNLLKLGGSFGLIATNTIAQGDTRYTGLRKICETGGIIFCANRRVRWPGQAAVIVSTVHVLKNYAYSNVLLDRNSVNRISAFLFHAGGDENPTILNANANLSFQGSIPLGMGFTFDDTDKKGVSSPISKMRQLLTEFPHYQNVIKPYLGGDEVNDSPTHEHHRYIINLSDLSEDEARSTYPKLIETIEEKVKPDRLRQKDKGGKQYWWKFLRPRNELYSAIAEFQRVLVCAQTSKYRTFTFLPSRMVYDQKLIVFTMQEFGAFAILQSRVHEIWALFQGSSMKDDPVYTPTDCFETFPFPNGWKTNQRLEGIGVRYYELRKNIMIQRNEGMTKVYNRFHRSSENSRDIIELRDLHDQLDREVLAAYGWSDIVPTADFFADYDDEDGDSFYRFRWPDNIRDQILVRLLDLNAQFSRLQAAQGGDE